MLLSSLSSSTCVNKASVNDVHATLNVKKTTPHPSKESAETFAKEYWRLMNDGDYESIYSLLSSEDKKLIHKDTFIHRTHQGNEMTNMTTIGDVTVEGVGGVVDVAHEIVTDPVTESTETVSGTFSIVSVDGRWHPKLDQADLFFYGAKADDIWIRKASMSESFSIPSLSMIVKSTSRGDAKKDPSDLGFTNVVLEVLNTGERGLNFKPEDYVAVTDDTHLIQGPLEDSGTAEPIEIGPGSSATIQVAFGISPGVSGYSLLVGQDDDHYLIPLDL